MNFNETQLALEKKYTETNNEGYYELWWANQCKIDNAVARRKEEESKIKSGISEFVERFVFGNHEFVKNSRIEYLQNRVDFLEMKEEGLKSCFAREELVDFINSELESILKEKRLLKFELDKLNNPCNNGDIDESMIERAREYPIENLIEVNERGFAICPFHNDKNPSAYCKNNFLHCFSCGKSADIIKLYQHLYNCNFIEAVKCLNQ